MKRIPAALVVSCAVALAVAERAKGDSAAVRTLRRVLKVHRPLWVKDPQAPGGRRDLAADCGIRVVDGKRAWKDTELEQLRQVILLLPEDMRRLPVLREIRREPAFLKSINGKVRPMRGGYRFSRREIIIADACFRAHSGFDSAETGFCGSVIHEWTHALNFHDPRAGETYADWRENPFMKEYVAATGPWEFRPPQKDDVGDFYLPKGQDAEAVIKSGRSVWIYGGEATVTGYSTCNPKEHLSEAMMFFLLEPETLRKTSPSTYAFLRSEPWKKRDVSTPAVSAPSCGK